MVRRFGVSRQTGFQYLRRFREAGEDGLKDRSRCHNTSPRRTDAALEKQRDGQGYSTICPESFGSIGVRTKRTPSRGIGKELRQQMDALPHRFISLTALGSKDTNVSAPSQLPS
jgi:hypothetical protein